MMLQYRFFHFHKLDVYTSRWRSRQVFSNSLFTVVEEYSSECRELLPTLPTEKLGWHISVSIPRLLVPRILKSIISFQRHFQAQDTDVILSSIPKSGATPSQPESIAHFQPS